MAPENDVKRLMHHMFLPPKLPHSADSGSHLFLVRATLAALKEWQSNNDDEKLLIDHAIGSIESLILIHSLQDDRIDEARTSRLLHELKVGNTIALHIKAQNAAVLFTRHTDSILVDVFELSARNSDVTGTKGRLVRDFPGRSVTIPASTLDDADFTPALVNALSVMDAEPVPEMQPKTKKGGVSHGENRDSTKPLIVSELLVGFLCSVGSPIVVEGVRKHTRDEINWDSTLEPWRRSPMWLLVRVLLQIVIERGSFRNSHDLYKKVILFVLSRVLDQARKEKFSSDDLYCMTAKLDQRLKKIVRSSENDLGDDLIVQRVVEVLHKVDEYLDKKWTEVQDADARMIDFSHFKNFNPTADSHVHLPKLNEHIDKLRARQRTLQIATFHPQKQLAVYKPSQLPVLPSYNPTDSSYASANLQSFEDWVHRHLETWSAGVTALEVCQNMLTLVRTYHNLAMGHYNGNPEAISKMLLTTFEMWVASDRAITQSGPFQMLADYDPGIETRVLQNLLLSSAELMQRLAKVETYLSARKQKSSMSARRMFTTKESNGLPCRYSRSSQEHIDLLRTIRAKGDAARDAKFAELARLQQEHRRLDKLVQQTPCEWKERVIDDWYGVQETERYHSPQCSSCRYKSQRDGLGIKLFEYPVPASQVEAESIVFELRLPQIFADWRDLRSFLLHEVLGGKLPIASGKTEYFLSKKDPHLSSHHSGARHDRRIDLLSTVKPAIVTHYQVKKIPAASRENICVPNALSYQYYDTAARAYDGNPVFDDKTAKMCMYKTSRPSLQRFLHRTIDAPDGCPHNEIIASQESCPVDMSLEEFEALLSLPLGRHVQWLNIGRELAMPAIDFRKADTVRFFLQCIYQSGPAGENFLRQSHEILDEPGVAEMLINRLHEALQRVRQNWGLVHALAVFVAIAGRIATLVNTAKPGALAFLAEAREVAAVWTRTLLEKSHAASERIDRLGFSAKSLESALVCLATYDVDDEDVQTLLASTSEAALFVEMSIIIQECRKASSGDGSLIDIERLRIERLLQRSYKIIFNNPEGINQGIRRTWAGFPSGRITWTQLTNGCSEWVTARAADIHADLHYNLITGELLVNGEPLNEPSSAYREQLLFKALFGTQRVEVMPSMEPGFQYSTKRHFGGFEVLLGMDAEGSLVVQAVNDAGAKFEVIPKAFFDAVYPQHFVDEFIHWCNLGTGMIHLASKATRWPIDLDQSWNMTRLSGGHEWALHRGDDYMIHLQAPLACAVKAILSPLATEKIIHTSISRVTGHTSIELPLSRLKFFIEPQGMRLCSRNYQNMHVSNDQSLGTLIGLKNKLMLTSDLGSKIALVPEASLKYSQTEDHISIIVDVNGPTRVHALEVDSVLHRLVNKNDIGCQLYLAYLHALTTSCLPDPLLQCSGTERALEMLRSKSMLSYNELTQDHVTMLQSIADLSPKRQYYPEHLQVMQCTTWNSRLLTMTQADDFVTVAEDIVRHFEQQKSLPMSQLEFRTPEIGRSSTRALRFRAVNRISYLRTAGHGAEVFTTSFDKVYEARDDGWTAQANNSYRMAVLLSRPGASPCGHTFSSGDFLNTFLKISPNVAGAVKGINPGLIRYSAACLTSERFATYLTHFPALQSWMNKSGNITQRKFAFRIWVVSLAFAEEANPTMLQVLVLLSKQAAPNEFLQTPKQEMYYLKDGTQCTRSVLANILDKHKNPFYACPESRLPRGQSETKSQYADRQHQAWQAASTNSVRAFLDAVVAQWPCRRPTMPMIEGTYIDLSKALDEVAKQFERWFDNVQFSEYLQSIEQQIHGPAHQPVDKIELRKVTCSDPPRRRGIVSMADLLLTDSPVLSPSPQALGPKDLCSRNEHVQLFRLQSVLDELKAQNTSLYEQNWISDLGESLQALKQQQGSWKLDKELLSEAIDQHVKQQQDYVQEIEHTLKNAMTVDNPLHTAGSRFRWPRMRTVWFLQQLSMRPWGNLPKAWKRTFVNYAMALCNLQRALRMKRFSHSIEDLVAEIQNVGHEAWDPLQYPEWLLIEVESGLTIRSVQREIAGEMMLPVSKRNSVMQLNMGEGKSTVIVPMIVTALADGSRLMRVIVNRPQSKQMLQMLISKLGGIIDRQVYQLPFARSSRLDSTSASTVKSLLQQCMQSGGILLMQPEHILSFQHMAPEYFIMRDPTLGQTLLDIQDFFDENARDVIDESDENFSVKLELIYTMGQQQNIEASPDRWRLPQYIFGVLRGVLPTIALNRPHDFDVTAGEPGGFPRLRLLTALGTSILTECVAKHISNHGVPGLQLSKQPESIRYAFKRYICEPVLEAEDVAAIESSSLWTENTRSLILILRGLFAKGLLAFVFGQKRWRVNYGLADRKPPTQLAVPYRAKDSPALRSEFSHPDVVIALTCLCYYYKGLSDVDLFTAIAHLLDSDQADINYQLWVADAPNIDPAFRVLQGVNLQDRPQCSNKLFPKLRFSKAAIDYFLSQIVFPKEIREFPKKLSASGWDIGKTKSQITTGFSGTNDSRPTLPLDVKFLDLAKQKHTNALVLEHILQPENSVYALRPRPDLTDAENILQQVLALQPPVQVILDAGAQVLEDNLAFAKSWLENDQSGKDAVVFVDQADNVSVVDKKGRVDLLHASPFISALSSCLVFLDQSHTRGIDLKLPRDYRAAVTLGPRLIKDNLVQACMRMRKLGHGQSVVFCVPPDVLNKIQEKSSPRQEVTTAEVIEWSIQETFIDNRRSMPLWKVQGERYIRQRAIWTAGLQGVNADQLLEKECQEIELRYRPNFVDLDAIRASENIADDPDSVKIAERCREFGNINLDLSALQEEQERELAPEIEQESEKQRAPRMKAATQELHPDVVAFAKTGKLLSTNAYTDAFISLANTSAAQQFQLAQLGTKALKVTRDFVQTVEVPRGGRFISDRFLRSVHWLLIATNGTEVSSIMVISPFEANELRPKMKGYATSLQVYAPRLNQGYRPMDALDFHPVPNAAPPTIPLRLAATLNSFAGQLYFSTYEHYKAFGEVFGLSTKLVTEAMERAGYRVDAHGFILSDEEGRRGGASGLTESPVRFLRDFTLIRNGGRAFTRTHLGDVLDGRTFFPQDFE
jgi:hypothetical protein